MTRSRWARVLVAAVVACLALAPLQASAATVQAPRLRLTYKQVKAKGSAAVQAFTESEDMPTAHITGHVGHEGGMYEDASLIAYAFEDFGPEGWQIVSGTMVANDGTYDMEVWDEASYRVLVTDEACVYGDIYYENATNVDSATSIPVSLDTTVTGIDVTVTPLPENIISGTVGFTGAAAPAGDFETGEYVSVDAFQYDEDWGEWYPRSFGRVHADGTYRLHLPEPGTYRVGFFDNTGVFGDIYYHDAQSAETATDVAVPAPEESKSGIDQTMTAIPSMRISGEDRYGTAAAVSQFGYPEGEVGRVVIATGENWPDAISGSVLASRSYGPLLLTKKASLPETTAAEIRRLMPYEVVIVGSNDAVSIGVEIALRTEFNIPFVWRLAGRDRYETAMLVAEQTTRDMEPPDGETYDLPPLVVASGEKFPDAMSAAPLAAVAGSPVLLVKRDAVPASVAGFLERHDGFSSSLVIGSSATISTATADAFPGWERLSGRNRYGTAAAVAQYGVENFDMNPSIVGVASGTNFPDGLAAVPVLASEGNPLLFTTPASLSPETEQFMVDNGTSRAIVFGGTKSVSEETFEQILGTLGY